MAKDITVLCLDVGPSMSLSPLDSGAETCLEKSIRVARQITQQKMFAGSKDLLGLVLFGTADTDHDLQGYENITVAYRPAQPTVDLLKFLTTLIRPGNVSADFIDAIVVALDTLVQAAKSIKRVGEKRMYLMTDVGSEYSDNQLSQISDGLKNNNVELIVVGPSISVEEDGDAGNDGDDDVSGPSHRPRHQHQPPAKRTAQQVAGEAVLTRLLQDVDGACFSFNEALQVSTFIRKNAKKQTARFVGQLEIGDNLKISCKMFTKVMVERPATWKKLSAISQSADSNGLMAVKMNRTYHLNDDDQTEVTMENMAKGYRYGKSLVPISEADETALKFEATRCLSLVGFTKMECVKQHQCVGSSVQVLVANPDDENAGKALSAFVHALYETNMVGVARYVWRKDSQPKIMVLIPKIKTDSEYLLVLQMPYMEDLRQFVFGSLGDRAAPSAEQLDAVDSLITNMNLMEADADEEGSTAEALKPKNMRNPLIQRTFQCIAHRALNPKDPLPVMEESLKRLLQPIPSIVAGCQDTVQRVKDRFPLEKIVKKTKEDATAQAWKKASDIDLDGPAVKRSRTDEDGAADDDAMDFTVASLARGDIVKVGTTTPVDDFCTLVSKKTVGFSDACQQLYKIITDLVHDSFGDSLYGKALDCVKALREETIKGSEPEIFNDILHGLRGKMVGTRHSNFWDRVVKEGVGLITTLECGVSKVTQDEAAEFLAAAPEPKAPTPPPLDDDMEDPDNLLDLM